MRSHNIAAYFETEVGVLGQGQVELLLVQVREPGVRDDLVRRPVGVAAVGHEGPEPSQHEEALNDPQIPVVRDDVLHVEELAAGLEDPLDLLQTLHLSGQGWNSMSKCLSAVRSN